MGWMYGPKPLDVKEYLREQFDVDNERVRQRCIDIALRLNVAYLAVEIFDKTTRKVEVAGGVYLIRYVRNTEYCFGTKLVGETSGPFESGCPKRILDLLSPTDNENAKDWRARCRENLAQRGVSRKLKVGDEIEFEAPVKFTDGFLSQRFTVVNVPGRRGRKRRALLGANGALYRVKGFNQRRDWKVVTPAAAAA